MRIRKEAISMPDILGIFGGDRDRAEYGLTEEEEAAAVYGAFRPYIFAE